MVKRVGFIVIFMPLSLVIFWIGGWVYLGLVLTALVLASGEYGRLFHKGAAEPADALVVGGTVALVIGRFLNQFESGPLILTLLIFASMGYHLFQFERGRKDAASDFVVTTSGFVYFGWLGSYFISVRQLPEGQWWVITIMITIWCVDICAYLIGRRWGHRQLSPHLSPKKTWEGFFGGILGGIIGGILMMTIWATSTGKPILGMPFWIGISLGIILALLTPLGDLGESMVKRQIGVKDSSNLIPGHGGAWDRMDSWLWGMPIAFYVIQALLQVHF